MVVISVMSGKGGVGKTTVTSNLASALSDEFKRRVIVMDANISSSHISLHFGMFDDMDKGLTDVMNGKSKIEEATYSNDLTGVDLVPSSMAINKKIKLDKLKKVAKDLASSAYDFVIIDSAPGFGDEVMKSLYASNVVVVVTNPNLPDVSDALKVVELAKRMKKAIYVVVNRVRDREYELDEQMVADMLGTDITMEIPEDDKVPESISKGVPVVVYSKGSRASIAFKKLAAKIADTTYEPKITDKIKWFLGF